MKNKPILFNAKFEQEVSLPKESFVAEGKNDEPVGESIKSSDEWVLFLINSTPFTVTHISTQRPNGTWTNWGPITPPVGKTCNTSDCDTCFQNNRYAPILSTGCNSRDFAFRILYMRDGQQYYVQGTARPDCNYAGGVACFS